MVTNQTLVAVSASHQPLAETVPCVCVAGAPSWNSARWTAGTSWERKWKETPFSHLCIDWSRGNREEWLPHKNAGMRAWRIGTHVDSQVGARSAHSGPACTGHSVLPPRLACSDTVPRSGQPRCLSCCRRCHHSGSRWGRSCSLKTDTQVQKDR